MNSKSENKTDSKQDSPQEGTGAAAAAAGRSVPASKKNNGIRTGFTLGLLIIVLGLGAGVWWQQQRFEVVAKEVASRLQQSEQLTTAANETAKQAMAIATSERQSVDQLSRELAVVSAELKTLQQAWEAANEGLDQTLLLNDLKRLITMADQELALFGNVNSAVSILSSVNAMLNTQSTPALKRLQQAVISDLARLQSVPQVSVATLSVRLDSLIELTGKAPLLSPAGAMIGNTAGASVESKAPAAQESRPVTTSTQSDAPASGSWWPAWATWNQASSAIAQWTSDASSVLVREFADVMSIRKADDPQALLLSEEQAIELKANIRAMLLSAQLALMTRQTEIWRSELTQVRSLLNTRYDNQALDTKAALNLLDELLDAPVGADVPQISETLSALASAERALTTAQTAQTQGGGAVGDGVITDTPVKTQTNPSNTSAPSISTVEPVTSSPTNTPTTSQQGN